jgi:hypothetical protein
MERRFAGRSIAGDARRSEIHRAVMPVFDKCLTHDEAVTLARFYESPAGQAVVARALLQADRSMVKIVPSISQRRQFDDFVRSKARARELEIASNESIRAEYLRAVQERLVR